MLTYKFARHLGTMTCSRLSSQAFFWTFLPKSQDSVPGFYKNFIVVEKLSRFS